MQKTTKTTTKRQKRTHMTAGELKQIRLGMKFAPRDMYATLGLPRRTYQDYESGARGIPQELATRIREMYRADRQFMKNICSSVSQIGPCVSPGEVLRLQLEAEIEASFGKRR